MRALHTFRMVASGAFISLMARYAALYFGR